RWTKVAMLACGFAELIAGAEYQNVEAAQHSKRTDQKSNFLNGSDSVLLYAVQHPKKFKKPAMSVERGLQVIPDAFQVAGDGDSAIQSSVRQRPRDLSRKIVAKHTKASEFGVRPSGNNIFANGRNAGIFSEVPAADVIDKSNFHRAVRHCSELPIVHE